MGRRTTTIAPALFRTLAHRTRTRPPIPTQRLRTLRNVRKRSRVVQRLVRPRLLRALTRKESHRPRLRYPQILARRIMAPPHQNLPLLNPLQPPPRIPLRRLRLPPRYHLRSPDLTPPSEHPEDRKQQFLSSSDIARGKLDKPTEIFSRDRDGNYGVCADNHSLAIYHPLRAL
jgi:hypothetical protein